MNKHKFHDERMKNAELTTQSALIRCVKNEEKGDWISLYGTNGVRKGSEYDDEHVMKYEWAAEYVPVHIKKDMLHFMVVPKMDNEEDEDVFYANFNNRMNLRHRPTDEDGNAKKGLSEKDKRFFKKQPMKIKLSVPRPIDNDSE